MYFTIETEPNNKFSFLDVNFIREQGKFTTNGSKTHFDGFLTRTYKIGMIYTLVS